MRFSYAPGAMIALLAAGPIFIISYVAGALLTDLDDFASGASNLLFVIPLLIIAIPFGIFISALPILLAGYGMARIGHVWPESRHPMIWGAVGAALAVAMSTAIGPDGRGAALFGITGAMCALIVRHGTRWFDENNA